jgi:hypothetical protein
MKRNIEVEGKKLKVEEMYGGNDQVDAAIYRS